MSSQTSDQESILLSELANHSVMCLRDHYDTPFVGLDVDSAVQIHEASTSLIRGYLAQKFYGLYHTYPSKRLLDSMSDTIKSKCLVSEKVAVPYRLTMQDDRVYYDPGLPDWGSLEVSAHGYRYDSPSRSYFRRTSGMGAMPLPIPDPSGRDVLAILQQVAPLGTTDQEILRLGFLLSCLWPYGPYPILNMYGPPESGKGFHCKVIRRLVDPVSAPLQGFPPHEYELLLDACHQRLLVLDNISKLPAWGSNSLCRISTGGSFRKRRMYTDSDMVVFHVSNPVLINSVEQIITSPDLVSRAMFMDLDALPDAGRRDEQGMLGAVEAEACHILDGLLRIISRALLTETHIAQQSRITPTFRLMAVAEEMLGIGRGAFSRAYYRNRSLGHDAILSEYSYVLALRDLLSANGDRWEGTSKELLTVLNLKVKTPMRGDNWPDSAHALTRQLKGMSTSLRDVGFAVEFNVRETRLGHILRLCKGK